MSPITFEQMLKSTIGLDAEAIGMSAIERAIDERRAACGLTDRLGYWEAIQSSEHERQALIEAVVVPETWFFRDREAFRAMTRILQCGGPPAHLDRVLRILSVPCSSGEEPYSIAMALDEAGIQPSQARIDAVDVSEPLLARARQATYGQNSFRGDDLAFRDRYFERVGHGFQLADSVRRRVHFEQGNLLSPTLLMDAGPYDMIFCRNLFIYFDRATQAQAIDVLTRLLSLEGLLFVGSSETGVLLNHRAYVSAALPMAFAFRRRNAEDKPVLDAAPAARRRPLRPMTAPTAVGAISVERRTAVAAPKAAPAARAGHAAPAVTAIDEAYHLADLGHFAEAAERCEDDLRRTGPSARAFYLLGLVRDASGNVSDAESLYRKTLYLDPGHREALVQLALLLERQGRHGDAQVIRNRLRRLEGASGHPND